MLFLLKKVSTNVEIAHHTASHFLCRGLSQICLVPSSENSASRCNQIDENEGHYLWEENHLLEHFEGYHIAYHAIFPRAVPKKLFYKKWSFSLVCKIILLKQSQSRSIFTGRTCVGLQNRLFHRLGIFWNLGASMSSCWFSQSENLKLEHVYGLYVQEIPGGYLKRWTCHPEIFNP